ncbi:uncharacterized protein LOC113337044 [Papaver somniferum]|uniref:uncharacterized protein LOC113337044 n=1 Tax=Papaver somniferum TaxID=3469 RepID=UPI000E7026DA|nr:uncharacterized protein LOC113337044 [Papaver somniferum]
MPFCEICMVAKLSFEMEKSTTNCTHTYCWRCIEKYISSKVKENITLITCPDFNCKEKLELYFINTISRKVFDLWESALRESLTLQVEHRGGVEDAIDSTCREEQVEKMSGANYVER